MPRERTYLRDQVYRSEARKRAAVTFAKRHSELEARAIVDVDYSKVRFEAIDASAMKAYEQWLDPHFCREEIGRWKAKEPMSFDLAIWFDRELCGLCFANPNQSRFGSQQIEIQEPLSGAIPLYRPSGVLAGSSSSFR